MLKTVLGLGLVFVSAQDEQTGGASGDFTCEDYDPMSVYIDGFGKDHLIFTNKYHNSSVIRCDLSATEYEEWNEEKPSTSMGKLFCGASGWWVRRGAPVCLKPDPCPKSEEMPIDDFALNYLSESENTDGTVNQRYSLVALHNEIPNWVPLNTWTMAFQIKGSSNSNNKLTSGYLGVLDGDNVRISKNNKIVSFTSIGGGRPLPSGVKRFDKELPKIFMTELILIRVPKGTRMAFDRAWQYHYKFVNTNCLDVNQGTFANEDLTKFSDDSFVPSYDGTKGIQTANNAITWDGMHYDIFDELADFRAAQAHRRERLFGNSRPWQG